jgi:glycosyltransferase involved in cell wall biosynthesis
MTSQNKIYVAGHRGMVGSAIVRQLLAAGHAPQAIITRTHAELDLTNQAAVQAFFATEKPDQVYMAAAKVGGIHANNTYPAEFIYQNLILQANVIDAAFNNGVQKLLFLGSSCIYPRDVPQPMREDALLTGPLEPTNEPYAVAKIAGIKLCESYNRQYGASHGVDYRSVMPTLLARADVLLVHLKDDPLFKITIPAKTQAYLAAGKAIVMAVAGDASKLVLESDAGVCAQPSNARSIADAIQKLAAMPPDDLQKMGENGRVFYWANMSLDVGARRFLAIFQHCT